MGKINKSTVLSTLLKPYIKKIHLKPTDALEDKNIEEIYDLVTRDFDHKIISIVEYTKICNLLHTKLSSESIQSGYLGKKLLSANKIY